MTDKETAEDEYTHQYYTNGVWLIRSNIDSQGRLESTETPNPQTGDLEINMQWIGKVREDRGADLQELSEENFYKQLAQKKSELTLLPGLEGR